MSPRRVETMQRMLPNPLHARTWTNVSRRLRAVTAGAAFAALLSLVPGCTRCSSGREKVQQTSARKADGLVQVPGSRVRAKLPTGFVRPGRAQLWVKDKPRAVLQINESIARTDAKAIADQVVLVQRMKERFTDFQPPEKLGGSDNRYVARGQMRGHVDAPGEMLVPGSIMVATAGSRSVNVFASYEPEAKTLVDEILSSIEVLPDATVDPLAVHGLALQVPEGLELRSETAEPVLLTKPGMDFPPVSVGPYVMLTFAKRSGSQEEALRAHLDEQVGMVMGREKAQAVIYENLVVDGAPGLEAVVDAEVRGAPIKLYVGGVREPLGTIVASGRVSAPDEQAYVEKFKQVMRSLKLSDPPAIN